MTNSHYRARRLPLTIKLLALVLLTAGWGYGRHKKSSQSPFQYVAGTENITVPCAGKLEVLKEGFTFACPSITFSIPYSSITLMQYRPDMSTKVMDMKIPWTIKPQLTRARSNKYFTIISSADGKPRAAVFEVEGNDMRPYFAEIELQSGKNVQEFRSYDEFGN